MPKATASWLIENTTLSFKQISEFVDLHTLEIQAIADDEVSSEYYQEIQLNMENFQSKKLRLVRKMKQKFEN